MKWLYCVKACMEMLVIRNLIFNLDFLSILYCFIFRKFANVHQKLSILSVLWGLVMLAPCPLQVSPSLT